ncbi:MAG TPA: acyltransferase [Usitatibacter sp.]|nr:acyltransferase [Usitatibacter sp.]
MGLLRTYLALMVVSGHLVSLDAQLATPLANGAIVAVKIFFLISGFYMSLVLDRKYGERTFEFYKSRALRLYPLYWVTCLAVVALAFLPVGTNGMAVGLLRHFSILQPSLQAWVILSNVTFLGSDLLSFVYCCGTDGGQVHLFPETAPPGGHNLEDYLAVPQSWTLGIEVVFYLVAPFLFRKSWSGILLLLAVSVGSRMLLFGIGLHGYDWSRHFILSEGAYFALGMASYRLYRIIPERLFTRGNMWLAAAVVFSWTTIEATVYIKNVDLGDREIWQALYQWGYMAVMVVAIPFLFRLSNGSRADFLAGELSYPIYITHVPTVIFLLPLFRNALAGWTVAERLSFCFGVVIAVALLGIALVSYPVEYLRGRRTMRARYAPLKGA